MSSNINIFMNYLTNYYKNLSEQLSHRVKLLENYLYEMNAQVSAGEPVELSSAEVESAAVAPPSSTPSPSQGSPGAPQDPGNEPKRKDGESDQQYQQRYEEWLRAKKRWETYQKWKKEIEGSGYRVFSYPARMPVEKRTVEGEIVRYATPPARPGDIYIGQNGEVWKVNQNGHWERA